MKKTILWGALFATLCSQVQADATPNPSAPAPAASTQASSSSAKTEPAAQPQEDSSKINCDYKIDASTKVVESSVVLSWSENATMQSFSFDPSAIDTQMQKLQNCFTEQGWNGFNAALQKSGNLDAIKAQHLNVTSQMDGKATLDEQKENQWKVSLPLQVVYQNDKEKVTQLLDIKLAVTRKPSGDLGITQMIATPRTANATTTPAATAPATTAPATTAPEATPPATTAPAATAPEAPAPAPTAPAATTPPPTETPKS